MDNISNLSSNLPPTTPINEQTLQQINRDLTGEFKNAAKSVASLYKLSLQRNSQLKHQGYLECVNDLLNLVKNNGDIENWALLKKLELDGKLSDSHNDETSSNDDEDVMSSGETNYREKKNSSNTSKIPADCSFTMQSSIQKKFPPTGPIMSVDRSHKKKYRNSFQNTLEPSPDNITSNERVRDYENFEDSVLIDLDGSKRRLESLKSVEKRPKH